MMRVAKTSGARLRAPAIALMAALVASCSAPIDPVSGGAGGSSDTSPFVAAIGAESTAEAVYLSLPPGSLPAATSATIRIPRTGAVAVAPIVNGGFDPVGLQASAGDTVSISLQGVVSGAVGEYVFTVPKPGRPVVIRTDPPPHKRDVSLNATLRMVFSEPVDATTLTSGAVQLRVGGLAVTGSLKFSDAAHTIVDFTPAAPLSGNVDYELLVGEGVRDVGGDPLAAAVSVPFTTSSVAPTDGPVASVSISATAFTLPYASTASITTTVKDAAGRVLANRPVTWTSGDPAIATVSSAGLVTAVGAGTTAITATSEGVSSSILVTVTQQVRSVNINGPNNSLQTGPTNNTVQFTAQVLDDHGLPLTGRTVIWNSSASSVATVTSTGLVQAVSAGTTTISAASGGITATRQVTVMGPVTRLQIENALATMAQGDQLPLRATAFTAANEYVSIYGSVTWQSSNPSVATVTGGMVTAVSPGQVTITVSFSGVSATTSITVTPNTLPAGSLQFTALAAAYGQTCGLTTTGAVYCWGYPQAINNTVSTSLPTLRSEGLTFTQISMGGSHVCGIVTGGAAYCWGYHGFEYDIVDGSDTPQLVPGGHTFASISGGDTHSCGVTTDGDAYCWGIFGSGELGADVIWNSPGCNSPFGWTRCDPVLVAGNLKFSSVSAGYLVTCGVTLSADAWCWGVTAFGAIGNGTTSGVPCGLIISDSWPSTCANTPQKVVGGRAYGSVVASGTVCALTTAGSAYCWGRGIDNQLGLGGGAVPEVCGGQPCASAPRGVAGGLTFTALSGQTEYGGGNTCGLTATGMAYCWGTSYPGGLPMASPTAVATALRFTSIAAGGRHTCGIATDGRAYCWGQNSAGELGNGNRVDSAVPVKVAGQP